MLKSKKYVNSPVRTKFSLKNNFYFHLKASIICIAVYGTGAKIKMK